MASSSTVTLDDLATNTPPPDTHLFYPTLDDNPPATEQGTPPPSEQRPLLKDRLYIGNLHPSVDEYTLLQVFSKFGKITKLDWLFHKTGLLKGKPRGYAFVEYASKDDALRALSSAHGKPLRGRTLVVTFAHQAPLDQYTGAGTPASLRNRKTMMDVGRPTTLSMLKTGMGGRHEGKTQDKIAMMEAKLRQMERSNPRPAATSSPTTAAAAAADPSTSTTQPEAPPSAGAHLPIHPSLPAKPPPQIPGAQPPVALAPPPPMPLPAPASHALASRPLGRLPSSAGSTSILPSTMPSALGRARESAASLALGGSTVSSGVQRAGKAPKLVGVKIKPKEKDKDKEREREKDKEKEKESGQA